MKSGKQRRSEIQAKRIRRVERKRRQKVAAIVGKFRDATVPCNPLRLAPNNSYGIPSFVEQGYYCDVSFKCKDCGVTEVWTAAQQRWWYEVARGDVWTSAVRCRSCRARERRRKAEARHVHLEGLKRKEALKKKRE